MSEHKINELREIPVELIDRNPDQPRTVFDDVTLAELADSIRAHGVIQPIEVEATGDGRYRLHHGERRLRASKLAGRETIPAIVAAPQGDETALVRGLLENLHREDLNPIDEARVYRRLVDEMGWSLNRIARETGRALPTITGRLAWLEMEPEIQRLVALGHLPRDSRLAVAFRQLPPEARVKLAEKMAAGALSLRGCLAAVENAAAKLAAGQREPVRTTPAPLYPPHPTPMIRHGAPGVPPNANGSAPALGRTAAAAAERMCRVCTWRPRGDAVPSWVMVEAAAAATCTECQHRDGPALPDVCRNCPGVAMLAALVGVKVKA